MLKKNILIIDDSALMRRLMSDIINQDKRFVVKDLACNGLEGLDLIVKNKKAYDCVILDINMPKMNGLELLEQIQKKHIKITVLMVSTLTKEGANETIIALERGAIDFVTKPENYLDARNGAFRERLLERLCLATGLNFEATADQNLKTTVSKDTKEKVDFGSLRMNRGVKETVGTISRKEIERLYLPHKKFVGSKEGKSKLIALACSTGGPKALQAVIPRLPEGLDAPMVLVQHMPAGFTNSLAQRLNEMSKVKVVEAKDGDILVKGCVYIAPGGKQMKIVRNGKSYMIVTTDEPPIGGLRPCANIMYDSLKGLKFDEITCIVLTGMGADGTLGIAKLGQTNNIYVVSQDEKTSTVYGMPKAVAEAGLSDEVLPLDKVADAIIKNVGVLNNGR